MANYKRIFEENHSYFLTVVTYQRQKILIDNIELLRKSFQLSKEKYNYDIDTICVLPDHFHMIITLQNSNDYPKIISHIKRSFVYGLDEHIKNSAKSTISASQSRRNSSGIWQKRYYEHTIRDEKDLKVRLDYIHYNPVKHRLVKNVHMWKHSSFHKYVKLGLYDKSWGDFDESIDFE